MPSSDLRSSNPKTKPNYIYSIISVALVLFLLGIFGMLAVHAQGLVKYMKENVQIMVELKDNTMKTVKLQYQKRLEGSRFVKPGSVKYVSKEEATEKMRDDFGENLMQYGINPLFDALIFNVNATYMEPDSLRNVAMEIKENDFVTDVYYQEDLVEAVASNLRKLAFVILGIGFIAIFITIALINNTVKLALYSNRFLIKNMQLVGASWGFIRRPYLARSISHGLFSGFIAVIALLVLMYFLQTQIPGIIEFFEWERFAILFGGIVLIGVLISLFSTWRGVNRYLKVRLDDLY
ncbi:MAG: permease-like cell division protein FtsX [Bacteroidota bacterium]